MAGRRSSNRRREFQDATLFPEQNPSPVLTVARDGRIQYANPASASLLRFWGSAVGQAAPDEVRRHIVQALDCAQTVEFEEACGSAVCSFSVAPISGEDYANLYVRDITSYKQMQEALRTANDRLQEQTEELQVQTEELRSQTEELTAANEELRQTEQALRESESRVRRKLESVLSPEGELGAFELADLLDVAAFQTLMDDFYAVAHIPMSIIDVKGRVLVGVGWQDICTQFHRVQSDTRRHCLESDTLLAAGLAPGEYRLYKCKNNLWDIVTPIVVAGQHVGNIFSGQFFFEGETPDRDLFRNQARQYGFDEAQYLAALDRVPRLSRETVDRGMKFFVRLADTISQLGYSNIKLARLTGSLRESEERFRVALQGSPVVVFSQDRELRYSWIHNPSPGFRVEEFLGRRDHELYQPQDVAIFTAIKRQVLASGVSRRDEVITHRPASAGGDMVHDMITEPLRDEDGAIIGVICAAMDITERKHAESNQLLMAEVLRLLNSGTELHPLIAQVLRTIRERTGFDAVGLRMREGGDFPYYEQNGFTEEFIREENSLCAKRDDGSMIRDADGQTMLECTCGLILSGRTDPSMSCFTEGGSFWTSKSSDLLSLLPEDDPRTNPRNRCIHSGYESVALIPVRSGPEIIGLLQLNAYAKGRLTLESVRFFEGLADNIGLALQRKHAEDALRELTATLESKVASRTAQLQHRTRQLQKLTLELSQAEDRERRRIAVILHEDLQQQIAGARFQLSRLKERAGNDPQRKAIEGIEETMREAIEKSRSLSHDLSPAVLHINDLAEVFGWLARQMQTKHGLTVHVRMRGNMVLESESLAVFLFRAAQEMLFNVVKHGRVEEATLRVRRTGQFMGLSVSDQGCGFNPAELRETAGIGLLSIRERIEFLGGRMKIKSTEGKGSRFCIIVPDTPQIAATLPVDMRVIPATEAQPRPGGPLRVLLADDHAVMRQGLASLLSEAPDIEVVGEASNGQEAVNLAYKLRPDVVTMDVSMPVMSGEQATRQIKKHLPEIRIVALSMHQEAETIEKMREAGADSYVLKVAPSEELFAAIRGTKVDR